LVTVDVFEECTTYTFSDEEVAEEDSMSKEGADAGTCTAYSLALKMEALCAPETSFDFQRTKRRYIREYGASDNSVFYTGE
jgi:hypothetical protein